VKRLSILCLSPLFIAMLPTRAVAQFPPAPGTGPGLAETIEAIDSARVTTRILYVTAHPDDESAAVLTYLARGLHADVELLSITRGEGGQNALGPEQAPQLGLIRTQELLAATRGYGVKLFFTRAPDFGFSKTPEETEKIWGDQVLEDMVRVIRAFRPNIVINNWGGVHGGHGHHQAAGLLTPKAVQLAADANYKLGGVPALTANTPPWGSNSDQPIRVLDFDRNTPQKGNPLPLDEISPLWGKTWREIGLDAFVNHRTQGIAVFLGSPFLRRQIAVIPEDGKPFDPAELSAPLSAEGKEMGCRAFSEADASLATGRESLLEGKTEAAIRSLAAAASDAAHWLDKCPMHLGPFPFQMQYLADKDRIRQRIEKALALAAGVEISSNADTSELVAGESFTISGHARCRPEAACTMGATKLLFRGPLNETKREGEVAREIKLTVAVSALAPSLTPEELKKVQEQAVMQALTKPAHEERAVWESLQPEPSPLVTVLQELTISGYKFDVSEPVKHLASTSTRVDRMPLRIVPTYTLAVEPKQEIEVLAKQRRPFAIFLRVHSYTAEPGRVSVGLDAPKDWISSSPVMLDFTGVGDQYAKLTLTPPGKLAAGDYAIRAYAMRGQEKFSTSLEPLPSFPTLLWEEPAQVMVHAFDISVPENLRVGYIAAEGEPIPEALERLGIRVEKLDAAALAFSDLSGFDAIVVGVRAYELRPELPGANQRLLAYVSNGGTLVVQYNRDFVWDKLQPAPYPAKIGNSTPRITDENSPVKFLKPDDPLLNRPNKITADDFKGWVQERGLYFWSQFDPKYTALLAMSDPGEAELNGGLVYTQYGKGTYIYTGVAFFRQLPECVPGAYRLFVNLLSASRGH
jgi:LmbE family N-acetylglucosaminyl deacetylase